MKIIVVLLDGLGDRSYPVLDHRTPLQAADTPNLDQLAKVGSSGLFHPSSPGQCLPSETAHFLLFGYDQECFPGRGLLEAVGQEFHVEDDDVACLALLCGIRWEREEAILINRREGIEGGEEELACLFSALSPYESRGVHFELRQTRRNDAVLILRGQVSPYISDSDPMVLGRPMARVFPVSPNPEPTKASDTAEAMNDYLSWCHSVLSGHGDNKRRIAADMAPANFLATQRCGRRVPQEPFAERWGMRGLVIASGAIYAGLAQELGMSFIKVREGPDPGEDLKQRLGLALDDTEHDFIHVHTKVPDEASHWGDPQKKCEAISALDRGLRTLLNSLERGDDLLVAVTSDHSTPSDSPLIHSGEPVPLLLAGTTVRRDGVLSFDEIQASGGALGFLRGKEFMLTLLNHANRAVLAGHNLGPVNRPYFPLDYPAFTKKQGESQS